MMYRANSDSAINTRGDKAEAEVGAGETRVLSFMCAGIRARGHRMPEARQRFLSRLQRNVAGGARDSTIRHARRGATSRHTSIAESGHRGTRSLLAGQ